MVADRYAGDGIVSKRTIRIDYQQPPPDDGLALSGNGRAAARRAAASQATAG
jgi:hypothetical protein